MTARARSAQAARAFAPATPARHRAWWLVSLVAAAPVASQAQPALVATELVSAEPAAKLSPLLSQVLERVEQLDPFSFAVLRPIPVAGSGALLRTGDVFVLQFSTSLPGQVRLENIDAQGRVADLGTHMVFVDQLNRIPRAKGIQLQGQPGLERLRFFFYPCLPPEAAGKPWATEFQGKLPPCTTAPVLQSANAGSHGTPYGKPTSAHYGAVAPRALVNLAQPDANLVFAGSPEYQPGDVTLMEAQIRHQGRSHVR